MSKNRDASDTTHPAARAARAVRAASAALVGLFVWCAPKLVLAQGELSEAAKETTIPGGQLVIVSYIALWLGLMAYVGYLGLRQQQLDDELDELERRIDETLGDVPDEE